jgi:citrate lyase alpha subunit
MTVAVGSPQTVIVVILSALDLDRAAFNNNVVIAAVGGIDEGKGTKTHNTNSRKGDYQQT